MADGKNFDRARKVVERIATADSKELAQLRIFADIFADIAAECERHEIDKWLPFDSRKYSRLELVELAARIVRSIEALDRKAAT